MADQRGELRILSVLETLATMEQPASLPDIVARTGLDKFKAYRALRALEQSGFVYHAAGSGYWIGSRSHALATVIGPRPAVLRHARPVLSRLASMAEGGAALHLRSGSHRVQICAVVPRHLAAELARSPVQAGERAPLTTGCSGTAILAFLPAAEAEAVIASRPPGEPSPGPALLKQIRTEGYAMSFGANHPGMNGIGAPLLDPIDGAPLGSIALAGADTRIGEADLRRLSGPLLAAAGPLARNLARLLGPNSTNRRAALDVTIEHSVES